MKKIFTLIGIMTVIFSVYFMLLVVDKSNYIDESRISDFSLSKQINLETLEECAKESNVCVQIRTFNNYSFGNTDCKVEVINPAKNVKYGAVRSLFPNRHMKIIKAQKIENRKVRYFTVQENNSTRVSKFKKKLEKSGFEAMVTCKESVEFNLGMLFSPLNIGFFISVFCLALFCTSIYYISRLKEIGILKLNGWSENRISLRLYKDIIKNTAYGFVSGVILFCIYIIIMDVSQLYSYLLMVLFLMLSLNLVYICVAAIAVVFIKNAGYIDSIKNKKNNKIIFIMTMAFKVVLTVVAFIIATQLIENAIRLNEGTKKAEEIEARNWYICTQHISPNEKEEKELNAFVEQYDDKEIFNYCPSDTLLSKYENTKIYKDLDSIESNMIIASYNLLPYLGIKDKNGELLKLDSEKEYLLVSKNLWKKRKKIAKYEEMGDIEPVCIASKQWIMDFETPGKYSYNSVIQISKLEKKATISYGDVFMTEKVAKQLEKKLLTMGYEKSDIEMEALSTELRTHISTYQTELFESVMYFVIVFLTYILVDISLFSIYYEFKKKKMAVYSLLGKKATNDISKFLIYNATIVIVVDIVVNKKFVCLVIPETIIFYAMLKRKSFESIGTVIKGR